MIHTGEQFGRLTAIKVGPFAVRSDGRYRSTWICRCSCGVEKIVASKELLCGHVKSCGCGLREGRAKGFNFKHGEAVVGRTTREYRIWRNMVIRCTDPRSEDWPNYGGRGIDVCDRWKASFSFFLEDMGRCPNGHSLDRIKNDFGYSKENCRWAVLLVQANNTRRNRFVVVKGVRKTVAQWARWAGENPNSIYARLKRGLDGLEAICGCQ